MSTITVKMNNASIGGRDEGGTWSEKIDITPEQFVLAFQGAQAALLILKPILEKFAIGGAAITLGYTPDTKLYRYVWLNFEIKVGPHIFTKSDIVKGTCTGPKSIEAISQSIVDAFIRELEGERNHRIARVSLIEDMMSSSTIST